MTYRSCRPEDKDKEIEIAIKDMIVTYLISKGMKQTDYYKAIFITGKKIKKGTKIVSIDGKVIGRIFISESFCDAEIRFQSEDSYLKELNEKKDKKKKTKTKDRVWVEEAGTIDPDVWGRLHENHCMDSFRYGMSALFGVVNNGDPRRQRYNSQLKLK